MTSVTPRASSNSSRKTLLSGRKRKMTTTPSMTFENIKTNDNEVL
jgi:hypothetical protein